MRRRPYSVVLFDELEKANPEVSNILLQILEEGQLTDSLGRSVNFRNTIIIMTSNVGAGETHKMQSLGFKAPGISEEADDEAAYEKMRQELTDKASKFFKPEFLNRLDDLIVFRRLGRKDIEQVIDLELGKIYERLQKKHCFISMDDEAKELLLDKSYKPEFGAREVRRTVEQYLEDPLAEEILQQNLMGASCKVQVGRLKGEEKLSFELNITEEQLENNKELSPT